MANNRSKEIGGVGRSNSALFQYSLSTDEYLSTLKWPNDVKIYDKMSRSDSQIKALLLLLELPIRSTRWFMKPADDSPKAKEISDFINDNLFESMQFSFDDFLKNVCTMFCFGHSVFEKVFTLDKGSLKWKKFAIRPQGTLYDWMYDNVGDIRAIQQYNLNQGWEIVEIPIEKLLIFSHDMQQGDHRGRSALRTAYKNWSIKDFLLKITNIGIERNLVGTPVIKLPVNADDDDNELAKTIVTSLRSSEYGGVTLPDGFLLELFEGKRTLMDVLPYIRYHDVQMSKSILAQFMNLGDGATGSFALSQDQSGLFLMLLNASAKYIASKINTNAIPELVKYNFASDLYPKLCFKELGGEEKLLTTLKTMVDGSIIVPDCELEDYIREMLELPEKKEEEDRGDLSIIKGQPKQDQGEVVIENDKPNDLTSISSNNNLNVEDKNNANQEDDDNYIENNDLTSSTDNKKGRENKKPCTKCGKVIPRDGNICSACLKKYSRNVSLDENINVNQLKNINDSYDKFENEYVKYAKPILIKQLIDLSEKVKATKLEDLALIPIKYKGELTKFLSELYIRAAMDGAGQVNDELGINSNIAIDTNRIKAEAAMVANNISERLKTRFLSEYIASIGITSNPEKTSRSILKMILGDGNG